VPPRQPRHAWSQVTFAFVDVGPVVGIMLITIGGMYWGIVTPTEAAALSSLLALIVALFYREMTKEDLWTAIINTIAITCVISIIVINGQIFGFAFVQADIGRGVSRFLIDSGLMSYSFIFFVLLFILYLALGAALDGITMMLLTVPVLYPA